MVCEYTYTLQDQTEPKHKYIAECCNNSFAHDE